MWCRPGGLRSWGLLGGRFGGADGGGGLGASVLLAEADFRCDVGFDLLSLRLREGGEELVDGQHLIRRMPLFRGVLDGLARIENFKGEKALSSCPDTGDVYRVCDSVQFGMLSLGEES